MTRDTYQRLLFHLSIVTIVSSAGTASALAQNQGGPTPTEKKPAWETSAALGLTLTRGNSDNLLLTGNILSLKKWEQNEINLGADGTYGEVNKEKNAEAVHGFGQYNRLFTERAFGYIRLDALHDAVADVEYRLTLSPGAGYYFIMSPHRAGRKMI